MAIVTGKHLAEALGEDYVIQMCGGALVEQGDNVVSIRAVYERGQTYLVHKLSLLDDNPVWHTSMLPQESIKSLADLAYPRLGYREIRDAKFGTVVFHLANPRSAVRGLRIDRVLAEMPRSLASVVPNAAHLWEARRSEMNVKSVYRPTFTPFADGIRSLVKGDIVSFATSADVAVVMTASAGPEIVAEILFRERSVGFVTSDGQVNLNNKILQRYGISKQLGL